MGLARAVMESAEPLIPRHLEIAIVHLKITMVHLVVKRAEREALFVFHQEIFKPGMRRGRR